MDKDVYAERRILRDGVPQDTPIVCLNLQKQFKDFVAIRDISFHVPKQSVFALLGANGAAKTTTINIMVGLLQQTHGKVYLHGYDMSDQLQCRQAYHTIGLCGQFDVYLPNLTVRQHLKLFAVIHGVSWKDSDKVVEDLASFVHLDEVLDKVVKQLSGGMKRRMSLAIALIG